MGDHDFPFLQRQLLHSSNRSIGIKLLSSVVNKPIGIRLTVPSLMLTPPPFRPTGTDGSVTHDPKEPCTRVAWLRHRRGELEKRFLHHIFGRMTPLPGQQHQHAGMAIKASS